MYKLIGTKIGMTQVFEANGSLVPITVVKVEPNLIVEIKKFDNYSSLVVGYLDTRENLLTKPFIGIFKKKNIPVKKKIFELRDFDFKNKNLKVGDYLNFDEYFSVGDYVDVQGTTKGHGFTGAIKLWNFATGPKSHGAGYKHRFQGSLQTGRGGSAPQKVWKGRKMAGRYGNETVTIQNLEILHIEKEKNLIFIKGATPGKKNAFLKIKTTTRKNKKNKIPFVMNNKNITA